MRGVDGELDRDDAIGHPLPLEEQRRFFTRAHLDEDGFRGFAVLHALDSAEVPSAPGIYLVLRESQKPATFIEESPGGRFKSRDPKVSVAKLTEKWLEGCCVLYIGKATNLRFRLSQYRDFGLGKPVGHWGGRYIWQLADARELLVCWKPIQTDPRHEERALLARFRERYGQLPFANLRA